MGSVDHDAKGERHGAHRWLHPNGELSQEGIYEHGVLAGKVSWVRPTGKLPKSSAWFDQLGKATCRYEVPHVDGVADRRHFTFYNAAGRDAQIAAGPDGRSINLGQQMHKVQPETVLFLVEDDFELHGDDRMVHAASIPQLERGTDVARGRYIYVGSPCDGVYMLRFKYDDGDHENWYVETEELDRAFTLAADYFDTARARLAKASKPSRAKAKAKAGTKTKTKAGTATKTKTKAKAKAKATTATR
jgi:hypothetical protein